MADEYRPVRRVVVGTDSLGRSRVLHDGPAPNVHPRPRSPGTFFHEMWTVTRVPVPVSVDIDGSPAGQPLSHSPPENGCHWRLVHSPGMQRNLDAVAARESHAAMNTSGASELKAESRHWNMHRTPTLDYAFCLKGERQLVLDHEDVVVTKGDIVVQLGNWHAWNNHAGVDVEMGYVMIGAEFAS